MPPIPSPDVADPRHAEEALCVLAEATAILSESLDYEVTLANVARSFVPRLGEACTIQLVEREGLHSVAVAGAGADRGATLQKMQQRFRMQGDEVQIRVARTGASEAFPEVTDEMLSATARDSQDLELRRSLGVRSALVVPLTARQETLGVVTLWSSSRIYGASDCALVQEIASRAALAVAHARLFEAQQGATRRLRLLADASTLLAQSLEVDPTLATLARLPIGWFSHACAVHLIEDGRATVAAAAANPSLEERLGRALESYSAKSAPPAVCGAFESRRAILLREVDAAALRELAVSDEHFEVLRRVGVCSIIVVPLVARGGPVGVLTLARTHGSAYDAEDLALAEELGRRATLAVDNARLFRRATEAIAVRDEFLSIAGHELNTPLTPLMMQLDSLRRGNFVAERASEKLDSASRQVTRLAKLVSTMLDVSRISGGRLHIDRERFDMAGLVDEIAARSSEEAQQAGSTVSVRADRPCVGWWDRMRIDQVLTNLLTNAIKYGRGGPIDVELACGGAQVRLTVRDHGIGIALEHQRRIFERFERAASPRHYGGFGLGLWIVRQIVEASGGSISVDSAAGEGSTFVVDLPKGE